MLTRELGPTRDHPTAGNSKNYRWSTNAQILSRRSDLLVIAVDGGGPGNRNDPIHYRGTTAQRRCQQHGRALADGGYRGIPPVRLGLGVAEDGGELADGQGPQRRAGQHDSAGVR